MDPIAARRTLATGAVLALVFVFLILCKGCRPKLDGCQEGEERCTSTGVPQVCSQQRWTNMDRSCGDLEAISGELVVCCSSFSPYLGRSVKGCRPASRCGGADGGSTVVGDQ